ncbi:MAG: transposase, partial [Anaerococcus sp.]|nr:transposase [Anaerococcus sp.]
MSTKISPVHSTSTHSTRICTIILYGNNYSPTTISNISKVMKNEIEAYHNQKIKKDFVVLYCDATYLPVRRDSVAKEAKLIYNSDNIDIAEKRLAEFLTKWSRKYPKL